MASEGLDIPTLNTLIMTTPRREVEQSIGRIIRKAGNVQPVIIDLVDMLPSFVRQANHRRKLYKKLKYNVKVFEVENNSIVSQSDINTSTSTCNYSQVDTSEVGFIDD